MGVLLFLFNLYLPIISNFFLGEAFGVSHASFVLSVKPS